MLTCEKIVLMIVVDKKKMFFYESRLMAKNLKSKDK